MPAGPVLARVARRIEPLAYQVGRAITPPVLMVLASCLTVLTLSGPITDLDAVLTKPSPQLTSVIQAPDGRTFVASVLNPALRTTSSSVARSSSLDIEPCLPSDQAKYDQAAPSEKEIVLAKAVEQERLLPPARDEELVGPPLPPMEVAQAHSDAPTAIWGTKSESKTSSPKPVPDAPGLADAPKAVPKVSSSDQFVGPPAPTAEEQAVALAAAKVPEEFVGPPLPADWSPSRNVVLAGAVPPLSLPRSDVSSSRRSSVAPSTVTSASTSGAAGDADGDYFEDFPAAIEANDANASASTRGLRHRLRWGETMSQVLTRAGVSQDEADRWIKATNEEYNVHRVYAGQEVELVVTMPGRELQKMSMEIDAQTALVVERRAAGPQARREDLPFDRTLRAVGGRIDHSLYATAQDYGIPEKVISDMAEILGWDVDLSSDIERGASFRVVYEELTRPDTMETTAGRVLAVELANRGKRHEGFYFSMPDGSHAGYYDAHGKGIGRGFLRFPVAFKSVTSNFSFSRFHPILKRSIPHYGVDFAAPVGTPVHAAADGRVLVAGWNGGNGKFVKIQHDAVYETGYSHLSSIAPSVHAGGTVRQGQVIGYVGATGLATGPHLHFAMYRNGEYVDPMKANLPRSQSLDGRAMAAFRMRLDAMERAYASAGAERMPTRMAEVPSGTASGGGGQ